MTVRSFGILAIVIFTIVCWILSMTADTHEAELGALFNLVLPPMVGMISIIIFLVACWLTKNKVVRVLVLTICCSYIIYVGLFFRFNPGYLPVPF